jgi:hypothetical protein
MDVFIIASTNAKREGVTLYSKLTCVCYSIISNITSFWIKLIDIERAFYTLHRFEKAHENYSNTHLDKLAIRARNHRPLPCIHWITLKTKPAYSNIINPEHTTRLNITSAKDSAAKHKVFAPALVSHGQAERRWWPRADSVDNIVLSSNSSIGVAVGGRVIGSETGRHGSNNSATYTAAQPPGQLASSSSKYRCRCHNSLC